MLTAAERAQYARQIRLPGFGLHSQRRLRDATALVIGVGGLGAPASLYLAAAGIGRLVLVDPDAVDRSNLHRQVIYAAGDVGRPKVEAAAERLRALNPSVEVVPYQTRFAGGANVPGLRDADVVLDGTDTFSARYAINDAALAAGRPVVFASVDQWRGQASVFGAAGGPCYRCLFPEAPPPGAVPSCAEGGVLGVLPGLMGLVQATEAIKWLTGLGELLVGRLMMLDAASMRVRELSVERDPSCPSCGSAPPLAPLPVRMQTVPEITPTRLAELQADGDGPFVLDVRQPDEYEAANIGGTLIPLGELPDRLDEIEGHRDDEQIVVHCRSGGRSAQAVELLHAAGFTNAVNLQGGIHRWSDDVDPSVPKV